MLRILVIVSMLVGTVACGGPKKAAEKPLFRPVMLPATLQADQQLPYMQAHYWDNLDFADTVYIVQTDTVHMLRAFASYVRNFVPPQDPTPIAELMKKASGSKTMLEYFAYLGQEVLHDPTSPMLNEELYIPVLEALLASPHLDEWEKLVPAHDLRIAMQNRIGQPANDFRYTLASGRTGTLYGIRADYTMIFINNPGCPMCRQIIEGLIASPIVTELVASGRLKILAIYPDEDLAAWREHAADFPATWINGYDAGTVINREGLYDLRAIPSIYLVDRDKRVLAKDVYHVGYIEYLLNRQEEK